MVIVDMLMSEDVGLYLWVSTVSLSTKNVNTDSFPPLMIFSTSGSEMPQSCASQVDVQLVISMHVYYEAGSGTAY